LAFVGFDIGGSTLKAVSLSRSSGILARRTVPAGGRIAPDEIERHVLATFRELSAHENVEAAGLAFGGIIQPDGTMREDSTNLPNLAGPVLSKRFAELLGVPCRIDNDARSAMRGEALFGAARGVRNAITLTLGSGIGCGLLLDGRIHAGAKGRAGEIGLWRHAPPRAGMEWTIFEDIAAPGRTEERVRQTFSDLLTRPRSAAAADEVFDAIGRAIVNAHLLLDLERVILVGAVTTLGEPLRAAIESSCRRQCPADLCSSLTIGFGELGVHAGAIGAAALWLDDAAP
jgi:glucokinase